MEFVNFEPLVRQSKFFSTATVFTTIGFLAFASFLIYTSTAKVKDRKLPVEITLGAVSSIFLAIGFVFVLLSLGIFI